MVRKRLQIQRKRRKKRKTKLTIIYTLYYIHNYTNGYKILVKQSKNIISSRQTIRTLAIHAYELQ